jgi:RNA polymerase sigma-54 factor
MALTQRLLLRQSQALVMTPQLMQAIKLLQLSNLELTSYVEGELERNPLLERAESEDGPAERESDSAEPAEAASDDLPDDSSDDDAGPRRPNGDAGPAYSEWAGVGAGGREDGDHNLEAFVSAEATLAGHLGEQLALATSDPVQRMIGHHLIHLVDDAGYLTADLADVAATLGAPLTAVEATLALLQGFDPPGVCARNLPECLAIQLKERDRFDPAMQALIGHLDVLARRDLATLRRICGVGDEDLADMIAEVRQLNPKPGFAFGATAVQAVVPDVFVQAAADGTWNVELNSDTLPKVLINQNYYARVSKTACGDGDKSYLAECLQSATWLVRALDQRAKTILKVASEIVRQQDAFFAHGVQYLRPLNLKAVADAIGMHESTVSRVTSNKYMATSRGIFELKYFFTAAIAAADGGAAHSAEAVRHRIRQMIDEESPRNVLSDDTIVDKLRDSGIDIARRTVAKYREAMRIPSSVQRRRLKQGEASAAE